MVRFDQHLHTNRYSPDSILDPLEMLDQMRRIGLDGVVITEHDRLWPEEELAELRAASGGLQVLPGVEVSAREGHFLVYGLPRLDDIGPGIRLRELVAVVRGHDAAIVAAHPYRWDQDFDRIVRRQRRGVRRPGTRQQQRDPAKSTANRQALRRPGLGPDRLSDAHDADTLGCYYTEYDEPIDDIRVLSMQAPAEGLPPEASTGGDGFVVGSDRLTPTGGVRRMANSTGPRRRPKSSSSA